MSSEKSRTFDVIAHIYNNYESKFGIPRQSGQAESVESKIIFEPEFRDDSAIRGIDGFSHLWLLWQFSEVDNGGKWSPTVRPPRLGGNKRVGVFATRSPFRPNPVGLSSVRLERIEKNEKEGSVLIVSGADLMNGTPVYDIKPYISAWDCHTGARDGFAAEFKNYHLPVEIPEEISGSLPPLLLRQITEVLSLDPRPSYQNDPQRVYGMSFGGCEIRFRCDGEKITVCEIVQ